MIISRIIIIPRVISRIVVVVVVVQFVVVTASLSGAHSVVGEGEVAKCSLVKTVERYK